MNALSRRSFRNLMQGVIGSVVVVVMVAAAVSSTLAAEFPAGAGDNQSPPSSYVTPCEAQLAQAVPDKQSAIAPLAGLALLRSDTGRFDLWRPAGWSVSSANSAVTVLTSDGQEQAARFSIEVMGTPNAMTIDDFKWRTEWFDILVEGLPNASVQWETRWTEGNVTGFEARYTFHYDGDGPIWRWVRLLYVGTQQYWLVAESPSTPEFDRLQLMFAAMMITFRPDDQLDQVAADLCVA